MTRRQTAFLELLHVPHARTLVFCGWSSRGSIAGGLPLLKGWLNEVASVWGLRRRQ